jgi:hypothetical protein
MELKYMFCPFVCISEIARKRYYIFGFKIIDLIDK